MIRPLPKKKHPSSLNDYRPVALTPIVMKCFERIVLRYLLTFTASHSDPFQFAYRPNRGTDDAILTLLHNAFMHLNKTGSFVRILFIDFSSAFNTIQPHLLARKLLDMNVKPSLVLWIVHFLVNRTQPVSMMLHPLQGLLPQVRRKALCSLQHCLQCTQMTVEVQT